MTSAPLLYVCVRPQQGAATAEYESFRAAAHLDASQLASLDLTQFHPEPTTRAFTERMAVYRDDGYFPAHDYDTVAGRVLAASVTEPVRLIRAFARAFGTA